ncbi:MAG: histidine phosphatase family protein [Candidatus Diapherotrites archaeon]|nr:histidine phosphatase family protein [Candidatus Diapherotrites archaeon]
MIIVLVRHGETDWNLQHRIQGQTDLPLNQNGIIQAGKLAEKLRRFRFDAIFSSDMQRALQTAQEIAKFHNGTPLVASRLLREKSYGKGEGKTREENMREFPEYFAQCEKDYSSAKMPGGESFAELESRVRAFFDGTVNNQKHGTILVVSHSGTSKAIKKMFLEGPVGQSEPFPQGRAFEIDTIAGKIAEI